MKFADFLTHQQFRREGGSFSICRENLSNLNISTNSKVPALPPMPACEVKKNTNHANIPSHTLWCEMGLFFNTPLRAKMCGVFRHL